MRTQNLNHARRAEFTRPFSFQAWYQGYGFFTIQLQIIRLNLSSQTLRQARGFVSGWTRHQTT